MEIKQKIADVTVLVLSHFYLFWLEIGSKIINTVFYIDFHWFLYHRNLLKYLASYHTIGIYFQRKPVKCIKAASALNRLLILCDGSLLILNMYDFEVIGGGPKLRGIGTFCVNENPNISNPFCIQV